MRQEKLEGQKGITMQGYKQRENFNSQNVLQAKRKRHSKEITELVHK